MTHIANIRMRLTQLAFGLSLQGLALAENALDYASDAVWKLSTPTPAYH